MNWLDEQKSGPIQSFAAVPHTFLNETSGEMYCSKCEESERGHGNYGRDFLIFICQVDAFEKFTALHLHGLKIPDKREAA